MTQKYTPAPWHVIEKEAHKGKGILHIVEEVGNQNLEIATMWAVGHEKEFQANAQLMAAAPEMLKALEEIIFLVENGHINISGIQSQYQKIRETVAKAKGES